MNNIQREKQDFIGLTFCVMCIVSIADGATMKESLVWFCIFVYLYWII